MHEIWCDARLEGIDPAGWQVRELTSSFSLRRGNVRLILIKDNRDALAAIAGIPAVEGGPTAVAALRALRDSILQHRLGVGSAIVELERGLPRADVQPRFRVLGDQDWAAVLECAGHARAGLGEEAHYVVARASDLSVPEFMAIGVLVERRVPVYLVNTPMARINFLPGLRVFETEELLTAAVLEREPRWSTPTH